MHTSVSSKTNLFVHVCVCDMRVFGVCLVLTLPLNSVDCQTYKYERIDLPGGLVANQWILYDSKVHNIPLYAIILWLLGYFFPFQYVISCLDIFLFYHLLDMNLESLIGSYQFTIYS